MTTPDEDRGRELVEIASRIDGVVQMLGNEFSPDGGRRRVLTAAATRLRALAEADVGVRAVVRAARALVELHDDPMLCNTGGPRTAAAIDVIRRAIAAPSTAPENQASRPVRRRSRWDRRELRIVVEADVDLFDVEAAESAARPYGIAEHIDRTVLAAVAAVPGLTNVRSADTALRDRRDQPASGSEPK